MLDNHTQAASFLERTQDETSIGKDFIFALHFYSQKAYKEFYLKAMGLVAGCKAQLDQMKDQGVSIVKNQAYYNLAYAYYLKAFAECTFLAARRQNIILQDDFNEEQDADTFNQKYFYTKATSSLTKARRIACQGGDQESEGSKVLFEAINAMQDHVTSK